MLANDLVFVPDVLPPAVARHEVCQASQEVRGDERDIGFGEKHLSKCFDLGQVLAVVGVVMAARAFGRGT